jgi:hypothetical protein
MFMGINDLQLTPELIAALYPETLVYGMDLESDTHSGEKPQQHGSPAPVIPFLGKNNRSICFLVNYPGVPFIPDEQLAFIIKILTVCKCTMGDIALVNAAHQTLDLEGLKKQLHPEIIFLWGVPASSAGIKNKMKEFNVSILDGISVVPVLTPELMTGETAESKDLKKRFWACLQKLFNL